MRCVFMVVALLTVTAFGCDGHTSVRGRVVDAAGKPVPEAAVKLTEEPDKPGRGHSVTATTSEEGHFEVGITHAPTKNLPFLFEVSKEGFVGHTERLTGTAFHQREIVLQPVER